MTANAENTAGEAGKWLATLPPWMACMMVVIVIFVWRSPAIFKSVGKFLNQRQALKQKHEHSMAKLANQVGQSKLAAPNKSGKQK